MYNMNTKTKMKPDCPSMPHPGHKEFAVHKKDDAGPAASRQAGTPDISKDLTAMAKKDVLNTEDITDGVVALFEKKIKECGSVQLSSDTLSFDAVYSLVDRLRPIVGRSLGVEFTKDLSCLIFSTSVNH
jgi:hypothetical protein